ncbi:hypothetical protein VTJ83DRAFT_3557 [Remersonia thermophila]|uniref:Uncharacterized protein n=1 Tax=Remersonia thermophila TaxID=72144 RepID=A0ABR4DED3_9PEZI
MVFPKPTGWYDEQQDFQRTVGYVSLLGYVLCTHRHSICVLRTHVQSPVVRPDLNQFHACHRRGAGRPHTVLRLATDGSTRQPRE